MVLKGAGWAELKRVTAGTGGERAGDGGRQAGGVYECYQSSLPLGGSGYTSDANCTNIVIHQLKVIWLSKNLF